MSVAMLSVIMLSVVMLSVIMLSVVMPNVVILSVVKLSVVILTVVILTVVILTVIILTVVILTVIILTVVILTVVILTVIILTVVILTVIILSVIMPSVVAPKYAPKSFIGSTPGLGVQSLNLPLEVVQHSDNSEGRVSCSVTKLGEIFTFGNFSLGHFYKFHLNCLLHFNIHEQFDVTLWDFQLSFDILATVLATISKIGRFFQFSGHHGFLSSILWTFLQLQLLSGSVVSFWKKKKGKK
jgi:hypothetical protein